MQRSQLPSTEFPRMIVTCMAVLVLTYPAAAVFRDYFHSVQTPGNVVMVGTGWYPSFSNMVNQQNHGFGHKRLAFPDKHDI